MIFEWDEGKNLSNQKKHGLNFKTAQVVFEDPLALLRLDSGSHGENRWQIIGKADKELVALVVFIVKTEKDEHIRIISARRVTKYERKRYEEG